MATVLKTVRNRNTKPEERIYESDSKTTAQMRRTENFTKRRKFKFNYVKRNAYIWEGMAKRDNILEEQFSVT